MLFTTKKILRLSLSVFQKISDVFGQKHQEFLESRQIDLKTVFMSKIIERGMTYFFSGQEI